MTNTKFRKKALLSSVAMLIVALIALSSATFAWFAQNPEVTTSGLQMQTKADVGLAVATESHIFAYRNQHVADGQANNNDGTHYAEGYADKDVFAKASYLDATFDSIYKTSGADHVLIPTSLDLDTLSADATDFDWYTASSSGSAASARSGNYTEGGVSATGFGLTGVSEGGVYKEKIYLSTPANATAAETVSVKKVQVDIDAASNALAGAIRVAVIMHTSEGSSFIGVWKAPGAQAANHPLTTFTYATGENTNASTVTMKANEDWAPFVMTAGNSTTANYAEIYVYLDGEDYSVFSDNCAPLTDLITGITVNFSTAAI